MAAVQQQVLNWLYSVLTSEYKDVNRTYNDVAQALSHYSSLSPRTDVYTYENGTSALLLNISGTLPVVFRGTTYRFPIALWVPHAYPLEAPLIYATPTEGMVIRPGQHVDPQGKIYHPYLVRWGEHWDKSNIFDFLVILRDIFAKEPPVISRQQQIAPHRPQPAQAPPPLPPLPPGVGRTSAASSAISQGVRPPPPPPKPASETHLHAGPSRRDSGPPLPPLPSRTGSGNARYDQQDQQSPTNAPQRSSSLRYETAPPLPPQPQRQQSLKNPSYAGPPSQMNPINEPTRRVQYHPQYPPPQSAPSVEYRQQNPPHSYLQQQQFSGPPLQWQQQQPRIPQQSPPKPAPIPDLLDTPLVLSIPSASSTNLPAPPVPPNPEKDMLLHNISRALYSQRQHTRSQHTSSLPGLSAQHTAMLTALSSMQAEIASLESLTSLLSTNTSILHTALHDADAVIESSQHRKPPTVDELLVAPTVVANQLYELVSEERSLGDAVFVLGRAVEKGRITPAVFMKMTRSLAREWYLKKALVKKLGKGMGLNTY